MYYTLNIKGQLMDLSEPQVMGILNVTPDSFYAQSRMQTEAEVAERAHQIVSQGGTIIDVGACSTRPGSTPVSQEEEMERLTGRRHSVCDGNYSEACKGCGLYLKEQKKDK